jgi:UDP-glucoronosyl and UDP-glucosyl transferase
MIKLRNIIRDQPISDSVDRAVWWIEYVIRNRGTVSEIKKILLHIKFERKKSLKC